MNIDIAQIIQKEGVSSGRHKGNEPVKEVDCCVCGEKIWSDDVLGVEYVKTKRGTKLFFHSKCLERMRNGQESK